MSYSGGPARAVLVASGHEDDHPQEGHDEAEDRDKHHPSQRVWWSHVIRRHQDPHQTAKHLKHVSQGRSEDVLDYVCDPVFHTDSTGGFCSVVSRVKRPV